MAWQTWTRMEMTGWQFLPFAGGLLDQPEALWEDLVEINRFRFAVKEATKKDDDA